MFEGIGDFDAGKRGDPRERVASRWGERSNRVSFVTIFYIRNIIRENWIFIVSSNLFYASLSAKFAGKECKELER